MTEKVLLLPSSKLVPVELRTEFGAIPSAMVPVDGRPAVSYISEPFLSDDFDVVAAVHENAAHVESYLKLNPQIRGRCVDVGDTSSLGETVLNALDRLGSVPSRLVVNFADTFVGDKPGAPDVVFYQELEDAYRWTTFTPDEQWRITAVNEKGTKKEDGRKWPVFVGVFWISNVADFTARLRQSVAAPDDSGVDPFYRAVVSYFNALPGERASFFQRVRDWRDFGHLDTYYGTKIAYYVNKRSFNEISIDRRRGIMRKTSRNVEKFRDEIRWYRDLPKGLRYLVPKILDCDAAGERPFLEMEFYGYPALSDLYLFGDLDAGVWVNIFDALDAVLDEFAAFVPGPEFARTDPAASVERMYVGKTIERLAPVLEDPRFAGFCRDEVVVNGTACPGLPVVLDGLSDRVRRMNLAGTARFCAVHGDFCFGNILYDRRFHIVRLVDPRGRFGDYGVYGDPRYDMAKLCHSVEGDYDFLVQGLFRGGWKGREFVLSTHLEERHRKVKEIFRKRFWKKREPLRAQIKFIEGLLFLSMTPLHGDRFASQEAFLARGLEILARGTDA